MIFVAKQVLGLVKMKLLKRCPLVIMLAVSTLVLTLTAHANREGRYREYQKRQNMTPMLSAVFEGAKDGVFPWSREDDTLLTMADAAPEEGAAGEEGPQGGEESISEKPPSGNDTDAAAPKEDDADGEGEGEEQTGEGGNTESEPFPEAEETAVSESGSGAKEEGTEQAGGTEPVTGEMPSGQGVEEENGAPWTEEAWNEDLTYDYVPVDETYLDDALFIGDSRTQGLFEYGGLEDHAVFYCKTSLTIYDLFKNDLAFIKTNSGNQTLTQALSERQFGKIYLMLGINEMGTGTPESFFTEYAKAVLKIRELQPNAILFVQGIMHVATQKNAADPIFNNFNIDVRNVEIQTLENKRDIFYLDVNEVVCDENGNLFDDWTFDQVHLKGKYYQIWKDFLLQHGIVRTQG